MTPASPSPWPDKRPPLQADEISLDPSSADGIAAIRRIAATALASGAVRWLTHEELAARAQLPAPPVPPPRTVRRRPMHSKAL